MSCDSWSLHVGDCLDVLTTLPTRSIDAVVTDPPYETGFMGKKWDRTGVAYSVETWERVLDALRPGGYLLAFGGTRTFHRLTCAIEDAGFEVRDTLMWLYGQGMPKAKSCLKPAYEPVVLARRPAKKVQHLNIDECRVGTTKDVPGSIAKGDALAFFGERPGRRGKSLSDTAFNPNIGRWPANVVHDGSDEVMDVFASFGERKSGRKEPGSGQRRDGHPDWRYAEGTTSYADSGSVGRFFYAAKATKKERGEGNNHPTVKPLALMEWLVKLVTPVGGTVLDPFAGSCSTGVACLRTGRRFVGVEMSEEYAEVGRRRLREASTAAE
jgi:site-specific DNA-methyltransferase (adenine-specific)